MATVDLTKLTKTQLIALLRAEASTPAPAASHWRDKDISCSAKPACGQTFRTVKGRDWHVANVTHPVSK